MKRSTIFFSLIAASSLFMMSCNSDDYNKETSATTEVTVPDTSQNMMTDTAGMMNTDTSASTTIQKQGTAKTRKGKVSTVMMTTSPKAPMNQDKQGYYSNVEVLPTYPGGQDALDDFVYKNLEYPEDAVDNNIQGIVTVNFAVDEAGRVSNAKIIGKPIGYGLEDAVLKAVNTMPVWTPGVIKGKNVKTYYTLPVNFKLEP
jgi:periplasmic protein TonB